LKFTGGNQLIYFYPITFSYGRDTDRGRLGLKGIFVLLVFQDYKHTRHLYYEINFQQTPQKCSLTTPKCRSTIFFFVIHYRSIVKTCENFTFCLKKINFQLSSYRITSQTMASQTQGIQQLLSAEKRAAEKVAEARKRKYNKKKSVTRDYYLLIRLKKKTFVSFSPYNFN
jgi:hypothetical protein